MRRFSKNSWNFLDREDLGESLMWLFEQVPRSLSAGVFTRCKGQVGTGGLKHGLHVVKKGFELGE